MKSITIEGVKREDTGKKASMHLRRNGDIPCVIYSNGQENIHFSAPANTFSSLIHSPSFCKAHVIIDGNTYEAILKEAQFHPVSDKLVHVDFMTLTPSKPIITEIPVQITGRAKGVLAGGKLILKTRKLKVRALPEHLTDYILVDVTTLGLNKSIKVEDLNKSLENIEILNPDGIPVVSVVVPRVLVKEADEEEGEGDEGAEGAEGTNEEGSVGDGENE